MARNSREIFLTAIERYEPHEWPSYLDEACASDTELRRKVESLLRAHQDLGTFREDSSSHAVAPQYAEQLGCAVGPYKLLEQIGEGGMGVVYMAEQTEPVERRVALKIIKPGMDTRKVVARFEAERQALAMMDHPNIAKVHDGGATESGRPYFVMELVKGVPVTQYCDEKHLTPRQRLELFVPICQAVQHAHQKGIIHRDLKPSNILVALCDDHANPKIIDFGVAKAIEQRLTEKTVFTEIGQVVGTPEYMSPEQAQLNCLDIDSRTDVYSLGVLLYELLTGETPFDRRRLRSAAFDELLRIIREEEPPRPSFRLSSSDTLPSIAANRHVEPKRLSAMIHGELDWIVMKALDKDRARRYETASKFAEDIQHYLNDEAVEACPPSAAYRFKKFAGRNKGALAAVAVVAGTLLLGIVGTTWQAIRATKAEQLATERFIAEQEARADAEKAKAAEANQRALAEGNLEQVSVERQRAEGNLELALAALDTIFLETIGKERLLGRLHPLALKTYELGDPDAPPLTELEKDWLRRGLRFYDQFAHQNASTPHAKARTANAYYRVALIQSSLGEYEGARNNYREAIARFEELSDLEPEHARHVIALADACRGLANTFPNVNDARPFYEKSVSSLTMAINLDPLNVYPYLKRAIAYSKLGQQSERVADYERAISVRPDDVKLRAQIAEKLSWSADSKQRARELIEEALQLQPNSLYVQTVAGIVYPLRNNNRGRVHLSRALEMKPANAEEYMLRSRLCSRFGRYQQMLADAEQADRLAPMRPDILLRRAEAHGWLREYEQALRILDDVENISPHYPAAHALRGEILSIQGKYELALVAYDKSIERSPAAHNLKRRAVTHFYLGHYSEALADLQSSIEARPTDRSTLTWISVQDIAACPDEGFRDGILALADELIERNQDAAWTYHVQGTLQKAMGNHGLAAASFTKAIERQPDLPFRWLQRGRLYADQGRDDLAKRDFHQYIALLSRAVEEYPQRPAVWNRRAQAYCRLGQWEKAIEDYDEAIKRNPNDPELYKGRAEACCLLARWDEAASDFSKGMELGDESSVTAYWRALAELGAGNIDAYRQACSVAIEQHGQSPVAATLNWVAWTCILGKDAVDDPTTVVPIAELAVAKTPEDDNYRITLGAALYRAGRYEDAVKGLVQLADAWEEADSKPARFSPAYAWYFLAMAHQQLGNADEAKRWLQKAVDWTKDVLAIGPTEKNSPAWNRRLTLELLRQEAEEVVRGSEDEGEPTEETKENAP